MITQNMLAIIHPVYEVDDDTPTHEVLTFLTGQDLPDVMSLSWRGSMFVFRSRSERIVFVFGFDKALSIMEEDKG